MTAPQVPAGGRAVKFSRLSRRGVLLGLSAAQLVLVGVAAVVLVVAVNAGGLALAYALPLVAACAVAAFTTVADRKLVDWLPVAARWAWRTAGGQTEHRARITRPRPAGTLALPGDAARLRQWVDPETGTVMVHDPHAATLTAVLQVTHPGFVLLDPGEQDRRTGGWGRVLAGVCRSGHLAAVQVCERTLPDTGQGLAQWWHAHGTRDDSWASRTYAELIDRAGPAAERHATTISLALDLKAAARRVRAAGGGMRGAAAVLRQEMRSLVTALHAADLAPAGWLRPGDLALVLRTAYDPATGAALERHGDLGRDLATAGPVAVHETWGALRADAAHHCVLWISQWPQTAVHAGFLAPLVLTARVRRTLSLTFTPLRPDHAARDIRRKKTEHISDAAQRARLGQVTDARHDAEYHDVLQQEADLTAGHGVLRTTGLIAVTADTPDELEQAVAQIEHAAIQAGCETSRLWGQQAQAFTAAALPLCRPT
jgi:hypothetical protein